MAAPAWLARLEDEDYQFIKRFLLASGSLKELAESYGVSYPTIRLRLDRMLERVKALDEDPPTDAFDAKVRSLVADAKMETALARELLRVHRSVIKGGRT
ncbi:MAG: DUF2089 family protein [Vicinamibacterales bacterium]